MYIFRDIRYFDISSYWLMEVKWQLKVVDKRVTSGSSRHWHCMKRDIFRGLRWELDSEWKSHAGNNSHFQVDKSLPLAATWVWMTVINWEQAKNWPWSDEDKLETRHAGTY